MDEDTIILFLDGNSKRAALQYQRMTPQDQKRTFWAKAVPEAIEILENYRARLDIVSLCYEPDTVGYIHPASDDCGMEVVRWLESRDSKDYAHTRFIVHTWNSSAGINMTKRLRVKGYRAIRAPFGA